MPASTVAALIDAREAPPRRSQSAAERAARAISSGAAIQRVRGGHGVNGVEVSDASGKTERIDCDLRRRVGGWNPTVHLTTHLNGKPLWSEALSALVPGALPPGMSVAGAATGAFGLGACLAEGADAGAAAAADMRLRRVAAHGSRRDRRRAARQARCGRSPTAAARPSSISRTT